MSRGGIDNVTGEFQTKSAGKGGDLRQSVTLRGAHMSRGPNTNVTPWKRSDAARWLASRQWEMRFSDAGCWSVAQVKGQLKEAIDVCERITRRDKPSERTGFWPATQVEWDEMVGQVATGELFELHRARNARGSNVATREEIAHMEQAIRWPAQYLARPTFREQRKALQTWAFARAYGMDWNHVVKRLRRPYSTMKLYRDDALLIIACGLVKDEVSAR